MNRRYINKKWGKKYAHIYLYINQSFLRRFQNKFRHRFIISALNFIVALELFDFDHIYKWLKISHLYNFYLYISSSCTVYACMCDNEILFFRSIQNFTIILTVILAAHKIDFHCSGRMNQQCVANM